MPNTHGGKNYKKKKRRSYDNKQINVDVDNGTDYYGKISKRLGGNRLQLDLHDGRSIQAIIPGKFMNRLWFRIGDIVQTNEDFEIVRKVKETDKDAHNAAERIDRTLDEDQNGLVFGNMLQEESDDEDTDIGNNLNNLTLDKVRNDQKRKETDKKLSTRNTSKEDRILKQADFNIDDI